MRPIISGDIKSGQDTWIKVPFLVDTGADRTVFSAVTLARPGLQPLVTQDSISGVGGFAASVIVVTQIRLTREDASKVVFSGQYTAVTALEALDISVLGRDITGLFGVIVDKPRPVVCLGDF